MVFNNRQPPPPSQTQLLRRSIPENAEVFDGPPPGALGEGAQNHACLRFNYILLRAGGGAEARGDALLRASGQTTTMTSTMTTSTEMFMSTRSYDPFTTRGGDEPPETPANARRAAEAAGAVRSSILLGLGSVGKPRETEAG